MRFGISEISWMFPKILRIRRCLVLSPLEVLRGASIALVAMCFPALCVDAQKRPAEFIPADRDLLWSAAPLPSPMLSVRAPFGPCPGEDGKSPGRTSPCGGAVYLLDMPHIIRWNAGARGCAHEKRGASTRETPRPRRGWKA